MNRAADASYPSAHGAAVNYEPAELIVHQRTTSGCGPGCVWLWMELNNLGQSSKAFLKQLLLLKSDKRGYGCLCGHVVARQMVDCGAW